MAVLRVAAAQNDDCPYTAAVLEHLWNGWRAAYVTGTVSSDREAADDGVSVFTQILASGLTDEQAHIVHRGPTCFVIMNAFPYTSGHLMVLPFREVAELDELTVPEAAELWATVTDATAALRSAYRPEGLNVGINLGHAAGGSVSQHLHVHVVPRWIGDANFMTTVADTRTLPEALSDSAAKVRAHWPRGEWGKGTFPPFGSPHLRSCPLRTRQDVQAAEPLDMSGAVCP